MPVGYHGRASSVVISGTPIHRPNGQTLLMEGKQINIHPITMIVFFVLFLLKYFFFLR